jgi:hypothetical protein
MSLEDTCAGMPGDERRRRQAEDQQAGKLRTLTDALATLTEQFRQALEDIGEGIPATPAIKEQLDRLKARRTALEALLGQLHGRYILQGADAYDWNPEGRHLEYAAILPAELARDTYPPGKLAECTIHFHAGPLQYAATYSPKGLRLESIGHAEYGDFIQALADLKRYHRTTHTDGDNIHDIDSTTLAANFTYPLPVTTQVLEYLQGFYGRQPRETGHIRITYEGITREEFSQAGLPPGKLTRTW